MAHLLLSQGMTRNSAKEQQSAQVIQQPVPVIQQPAPELETKATCLARRMAWTGLDALADAELIALFLEEDQSSEERLDRAQQMLKKVGGLLALRTLRPHALQDQCHISTGEAQRLAAAIQIGRRMECDALIPPPTQALTFDQVVRWARPRLAGLEHEEVWVLCVNSYSALRSAWQIGRGGMHGCGLLARDLLVPVIRDGASGFILVHNHPSGDPTPSPEDIELTRGVQLASASLCVPLLDHVIVAKRGAQSFFELGYLDGPLSM